MALTTHTANVFLPGCLGPVKRDVVLAEDAEAELAALREELAIIKGECIDHVNLHKAWTKQRDDMQQSLTAAEQRNSELTGLLVSSVELIPMRHTRIRNSIDAALKPTESGASG